MTQSLWIAKTGLDAQQTKMAVISNNLANTNTTGFKRDRASFEDLLYQTIRQPGGATSEQTQLPTGLQVGLGTRAAATARDFSQANLQQSGGSLDLAIKGNGFFQIQMPDGTTAYPRDGSFQLSPTGQIVTHDGNLLIPNITINPNAIDVTINNTGSVLMKLQGQVAPSNAGTITLATFPNDAGLEAVGNNLYLESPASGTPTAANPGAEGYGTLLQGFLETSNVNSVNEITALITAQRAYEMNSKVVSAADQMLQDAARLGGS